MKPSPIKSFRTRTLLGAVAGWLAISSATDAQTSSSPRNRETVTLSPFVVSTDKDRGYTAANTEAGSRLNARLLDTPSPISVMTAEFLQDIGATTVQDALEFAVGTERYRENDDGQDWGTAYRIRGIRSFQTGRNFFLSSSRGDTYNLERLTFSRGPNAILFGAADPAGIINYNTKRAFFGRRLETSVRLDDLKGWRTTVDVNQTVIPKRLAVRVNALKQDLNGARDGDYDNQNAYTLAATAKLIESPHYKATLRLDVENVGQNTTITRLDTITDRVTPWINAGQPGLATAGAAGSAATRPAGVDNLSTTTYLIGVTQSKTPIPVLDWRNMGRGAAWSDGTHELATSDVWPIYINASGSICGYTGTNFHFRTVTLEQQIGRKLFIEAAYNEYDSMRRRFNGGNSTLSVDVNRVLPNGQPNPNFGQYYFENNPDPQYIANDQNTTRISAAYELDFRESASARWLGYHRFATAFDDRCSARMIENLREVNATPLPGASPLLSNSANYVSRRYYLDRSAGIVNAVVGLSPIVGNGVNSAWLPVRTPVAIQTKDSSLLGAVQSYWWHDRLVTTVGLRHDKVRAYDRDPAVTADARGIWPGASKAMISKTPVATQNVNTSSTGAVFHATKWLSLFFNRADNFSPETTRADVFGNNLNNPTGKGRDYGVKFTLLDGRLSGSLGSYQSSKKGEFDGNSAPFNTEFLAIWDALNEPANSARRPGGALALAYRQTRDYDTKGYEFDLTFNITDDWRVSANGSYNETVLQNQGPQTRAYINQHLQVWRASGSLVTTVSGQTINQLLDNSILSQVRIWDASAGGSAPFVRKLNSTLVTNYSFRRFPALRGFAAGGSLRYAGKPIIGYGNNAAGFADHTRPFYGNEYYLCDAHLRYERKLWHDQVRWTTQVNVRNVFDFRDALKMRVTALGRVDRYNLVDPRTVMLTNSFRF